MRLRKEEITGTMIEMFLDYNFEDGVFKSKISSSPNRGIDDIAGSIDKHGYINLSILGTLIKAHHIAWVWMTGKWPNEIDHINGIRSDNRFVNLREVTRAQNLWNSKLRSDNSTGYKGITFDKERNKWQARITHNKNVIHLGRYDTFSEAVEIRLLAEKKYHGEYTKQSFV